MNKKMMVMGAFAMKTNFKVFMLFGMCAFVSLAEAATTTFDLRTAPKSLSAQLLSASAGSCLQTATLPAGATAAGALSVGDTLAFLLFKDTEIHITLSERMESPLGGEAFIGTVSGYDGVKNAVVLQTADGLTVDIQDFARNRTYTIVSDANGVTVKEIDPSRDIVTPTAPVDPGIPSDGSRARLSASPRLQSDQPSTLVDVLVAYDTAAASWANQNGGGITNFATTAVQKMNTVLANCGFGATFRYRLVGVMTVNATGGTDLDGVLSATRNGTGNWAPVKVKRDEVGADIVTTLIDTGSASGNTGLGYSLSSTPLSSFSESPYNVCAVRAVANGHTMTHEVGHNIGAGHATAVNPSQITPGPQLYEYSAGYYFTGTDGVAYHTIMAYYFDGYGNHYSPAPFFSSPNYTYQGTPVGDATHDNVRTIQQTYLAASQWRAQKIPMSYDVFFSPESGSTFTDSITVTLTPGKSGLDIRYTLNGAAPTTSSTRYTGPITLTQTTTIRAVTVMDGVAGPIFEATYSISDLGNGLDAPQLNWRTSDTHPWFFQTTDSYDGVDAVQSTDTGDYWSNKSWIETTVTGPTMMSFRYKMRTYYGTFAVLIDNQEEMSDSRDIASDDWHLVEVSIPSGTHTVRFNFDCDWGRWGGFNGVWLDTVQFDALSRPPMISPATTAYESTAYTFQGSQTITITSPAGKQGVLYYTADGSDPTRESQLVYEGPITITKSARIRAVFVEGGKEPSTEVGGLYIERHPVSAGEWTTNVEGAKTAAAQNGRLIAVLLANRAGCWWSQQFYPIAESPEFLTWAKANGIYLVTGDRSCNVDAESAYDWFLDLCYAFTGSYGAYYPQMYFVLPSNPNEPIDQGLARNDDYSLIGSELYLDTVESLIAGFASVLGEAVPQAPTCSQTESLVDGFPLTVTLANPNGSGTIYYTLDGSSPTASNGTAYSGAITITSAASILSAAVWPASGLSSPVSVGVYKTVADVFGTSDVTWTRSSGIGSWRIDISSPRTLRVGGLQSSTYTATLQATVSGKGKLVFSYEAKSWAWNNRFTFEVNGTQKLSCSWNGTSEVFSGTETHEVTSDVTTTYVWTYTVGDSDYDRSQLGVWLRDVQWIPEGQEDVVVVSGVSVPYTWLDTYFSGQGTSAQAYKTLANADQDNDGFTTWQEYLAGTSPTSAASQLKATIRMEGSTPVVEWNTTNSNLNALGYRYVPKGTTNLTNPINWQPMNSAHRFFKVFIEPVQ